MKKLVGLTAIVILFSLTINAQGRKGGIRQNSDLSTEQQATLQAKKLTLILDLNENQQKEVQKMLLKSNEEREKIRADYRQKKQSGKLTANEKYAFENERIERQLAHKTEMKKILTENQYGKWENEIMGKMNMGNRQRGDCDFQRNGRNNSSNRPYKNRS